MTIIVWHREDLHKPLVEICNNVRSQFWHDPHSWQKFHIYAKGISMIAFLGNRHKGKGTGL